MPQRDGPPRPPGLAHIRAHQQVARQRTDKFAPTALRLSWTIFMLLHAVCFLYFAIAGWCYWNLPGTRLDAWLSMLYIGIGTEYERPIAIVHGAIAAVHGAYIVWMIGWSFKKKKLVFAVYNVITLPIDIAGIGDDWPVASSLKNGLCWVYRAVFTRDGIFGVDGPNFDLVLLCREIVETALQTQQAYRMSLLLPRTMLNRSYVALLVVNCWTTALVHSVYHENTTQRRLLALICDCILDLVSSVGISSVLVAIYIKDFNLETYGFPFEKWYEDVWRVYAMSEFQMILVSSREDFAMRFIFAMSMLGNLNNMKKLMRAKPTGPVMPGVNFRHRATAVAPYHASLAHLNVALPNGCGMSSVQIHYWVSKLTEFIFLAWGLIVLVLHLHANSISGLPQCKMQVKPWTSTEPSCSLLVLDCYESEINGTEAEINKQWSTFDPTTVVRTVIRHCPALEVPATLIGFLQLKELKFYNTTITSWGENAAITQSNHPMLTTLFLIRVNMTNGELPMGLQLADFPESLEDIEFCVTNLRTLPENLDMVWPQYASIYIEAGEFEEVPSSLVRLAPYDLSLSMNPISIIPRELFESDSVAYLSFGGTLISQLPEDVTKISSSLFDVNLSDTNVSFFWPWIDSWVITDEGDYPHITAGNTPYCRDFEHVLDGSQSSFSEFTNITESDSKLSILLDASSANRATLEKAVSCEAEKSTWYPLDFEDEYSGVSLS